LQICFWIGNSHFQHIRSPTHKQSIIFACTKLFVCFRFLMSKCSLVPVVESTIACNYVLFIFLQCSALWLATVYKQCAFTLECFTTVLAGITHCLVVLTHSLLVPLQCHHVLASCTLRCKTHAPQETQSGLHNRRLRVVLRILLPVLLVRLH